MEKGYLSPSSYLANYAPLEIEVKLRAGFVLESIQLDGINVVASFIESSSAYIFIVDWNALPRHAHFIEIRAKKT